MTPPAASASTPPVGFKEWSLVCDQLGSGRQSLILRKGGIAEGRAGFQWRHDAFYLFPTVFHGQTERLRPEELPSDIQITTERPDPVVIRFFARIEKAVVLRDLDAALRLRPLHVWTDDIIRERFHADGKDEISLAFLRVHRLEVPWIFPDAKAYAGCRSWVNLPEPAPEAFSPVLDDETHHARQQTLAALLGEQG